MAVLYYPSHTGVAKGVPLDRDHELSAVLADETRYRIYRTIAEHPGVDVTVAEIAEQFHLHPNVARMHLAKLEQSGFLTTSFRHSGGGGRPAKLYRLSSRVLVFGFPPRRYETLARLALDALVSSGAADDAVEVCRQSGVAEGRRLMAEEGSAPTSAAEVADMVRRMGEDQGMLPEVAWVDGTLKVTIRNCAFGGISETSPDLVCPMHRAFLSGLLEAATAHLGQLKVEASACAISRGDDRCELLCSWRQPHAS